MTSTTVNSLYFDGFDEEIGYDSSKHELVLFDNVVTTGGTFQATVQLLRRWSVKKKRAGVFVVFLNCCARYPSAVVAEAVVMWTEGYSAFSSVALHDGTALPIHSLGGHIPIFKESDIAGAAALRPPQFVFRSSARFPCA